MNHLMLTISIPDWTAEFLRDVPPTLPAMEDRMRLVIDLARQNVRRRTGGPFAAAVFDEQGMLVAPGVNMVQQARCSILHAEIVALCSPSSAWDATTCRTAANSAMNW